MHNDRSSPTNKYNQVAFCKERMLWQTHYYQVIQLPLHPAEEPTIIISHKSYVQKLYSSSEEGREMSERRRMERVVLFMIDDKHTH